MSLFSFALAARCAIKDWTRSRFASFKDGVPQKSAAYALTRGGSRLYWRISRQSLSRKRGWPLSEPVLARFAEGSRSAPGLGLRDDDPNTSTGQRPIRYAFRRARLA